MWLSGAKYHSSANFFHCGVSIAFLKASPIARTRSAGVPFLATMPRNCGSVMSRPSSLEAGTSGKAGWRFSAKMMRGLSWPALRYWSTSPACS